jgi:hypothetical protein
MAKSKKIVVVPEFLSLQFRALGGEPALAWLILPWALLVGWTYRANYPRPVLSPSYWTANAPSILKTTAAALAAHGGQLVWPALFAALAVALGRGLLRRLAKIDGLNAFESFSYSLGLGFGALSLTSFALGAMQLFHSVFVYGAIAALGFVAVKLNAGQDARPSLAGWGDAFAAPACGILAFTTVAILLFEAARALAPEISFDALVYHMALPGLYRSDGGLTATPTNVYSGFPQLMEWAYALMLFFSDEISAKLLHWVCGLGLAAAFVGLGVRSKRPLAGWVACVVFLATPMTIYNVVKAAVDVGSSFFILLSVCGLAIHLSERDANPESMSWMTLSAVFCGLAMGVKYTNWPLLPVLLLSLALLGSPRGHLIRFTLVAGCLVLPWLLRNAVLYHNPLFPFFQDLVAPGWPFEPAWRRLRADAWGRDWPATLRDGPALFKALLHPWFATVKGNSEFDHLGPLYLSGLPALLWLRPARTESRLLLWSALGLWLFWFATTSMPRFLLPGLALLSVFLGLAADHVADPRLRRGLAVILAALALDAGIYFVDTTSGTGADAYLNGKVTKAEFLGATRPAYPSSYFKAAQWINKRLPPDARLLLVNGGRGYYLERPFITSTVLDEDIFVHWIRRSRTVDDLVSEFRRAGVSYMMVNVDWMLRTPPARLTQEQLRIVGELFATRMRLRYNDIENTVETGRWVRVYELIEGPQTTPVVPSPLVWWYQNAVDDPNARGKIPYWFVPQLSGDPP